MKTLKDEKRELCLLDVAISEDDVRDDGRAGRGRGQERGETGD